MNPAIFRIYFKTFLSFLCVDFFWLSYIAPSFYRAHISHLLAPQTNLVAAGAFYLIFIGGMVFFGVYPSLEFRKPLRVFLQGGAYGFFTYATFDLTSQAVFKDWPTVVTLVDLLWGTLLSGGTTWLVYWSEKRREN